MTDCPMESDCPPESDSTKQQSDCPSQLDFTKQPARRKNIKPDAQRKLLKRALVDVLSGPPICVLYSLVEKESFHFESVSEGGHHKAILYIDGQIFTAQSVHKKTARDLVVMKALQHLFPDIAQELLANSLNETLSVSTNPLLTLPGNKLNGLHITKNQNGGAAKKAKIEDCADINAVKNRSNDRLPTESGSQPGIESIINFDKSLLKAALKPKSIVRLVTQAVDTSSRDHPNAVNALHSLFDKEAYSYSVTKVGSDTQFEFEATLSVGGKIFKAVGKTIKKSKNNVTIQALHDLFPEITSNVAKANEGMSPDRANDDGMSPANAQTVDDQIEVVKMPEGWPQRRFADFIAELVQNKYKEVVRDEPEHLQRYNVLAGIVMMQSGNFNDATVICVSTGNKCVQGDLVSIEGDVLFDCHAEILSRRCLLSFLYAQLSMVLNDEPNTIIAKSINGRYRVKEGIKFYLYISSAPCGDGRVFTFSPPKNPNSRKMTEKRGMLRVKPESGMGGIPVALYSDKVPTYQEYLHGRQFVLMCCSAKLLRCNVLGTQGALLSHFLEPVYFDGVLIGDIFHEDNVTRALYKRLSFEGSEIPAPYRLNKPFIEGTTDGKICTNLKPSKSSMNWMVHDARTEFLCTKRGKLLDGSLSRLCKLNMFANFKNILNMCDGIAYSEHSGSISYKMYKLNSLLYQGLKQTLYKSLESDGRGKWISKTDEFDEFYCNADSRAAVEDGSTASVESAACVDATSAPVS